MRTIFDYINDILSYKKGNLLDNIDDESQFNSYMVNRWLSMRSPVIAQLVNDTSNRLYSVFETKKEHYNFLVKIIPTHKPKRIFYIKKADRSQKSDEDENIEVIAKNMELSKREINYYIERL